MNQHDHSSMSPQGKEGKSQNTQEPQQAVNAITYTCPMHPEVLSDKPGSCPKCGMTLVKKERAKNEMSNLSKARHDMDAMKGNAGEDKEGQYTCPMHPEVVSDIPGNCPKCGMTLVPKKRKGKNVMWCGYSIKQYLFHFIF